MRTEASITPRSRAWSRSTRGVLRAGVPLLAAVAVFSCTAYAPALDRGNDASTSTPAMDIEQLPGWDPAAGRPSDEPWLE